MKGLADALAAWRGVLGEAAVAAAGARVEAANRATLAAPGRVMAVLSPGSRDQVRDCLRIATRFGVAVHAVSLGRNWGYGSSLPPRGEAVLLSLAGLDRVVRVDEAMGVARVEPGVSFAQLGAHLRAAGSRLLPPWTGSGPHTSLVGNVLERGIGKGLYEDMAAHACGFEVVLAEGGVLHTGPEEPWAVAGLAAEGCGPGLAGLFVQSNLGVVTAMDFRLQQAPALQQLLWARLPDGAALAACVDAMRPLLQRGDPWLRLEVVSLHRAATQGAVLAGGGWLAVVTVWGDGAEDLAVRRARAAGALGGFGGEVGMGAAADGASGGMDADWLRGEGLRGAYAAKPGGMPNDPDPDRDGCGIVWVAPALPMVGHAVAGAVEAIAGLLATWGFGPAISLRQFTGRTVHAVVGLFHDRAEPGGDARAAAAAAAVHGWLRSNRLAPYRLGVTEMAQHGVTINGEPSGRDALLRGFKRVADPACVLSPGRYVG